MRIKQDFVTNSSSTSFIFGFPNTTKKKDKKISINLELDLTKEGKEYSGTNGFENFLKDCKMDIKDPKALEVEKIISSGGSVYMLEVTTGDEIDYSPEKHALLLYGNKRIQADDNLKIIDKTFTEWR